MLLFKKIYFDAIRDGSKTTTLRFWRHRRVKPGSVHTVPHLGKIKIDTVEIVELDDLSENDARRDGFESLQALREAIAEMYPADQRQGRNLYKVQFTFIQ